MFAYVDGSVKEELIRSGQLVGMDETGRPCAMTATDPMPFINMVGPVPLPVHLSTGIETFRWYAFVRHSDLHRIEQVVEKVRSDGPRQLFALISEHMAVNSVMLYGPFESADVPLVRVHSNCLTGDVFGSLRCDCGPQLITALERIVAHQAGGLVYMAGHEGRGIGLWAKAITYLLQDAGQDTYQANAQLGLPSDSRDFTDAGRVLRFFRGDRNQIRVLGNNPMKRADLEKTGINVCEQLPLVTGVSSYNVRYLNSKREHGHIIPQDVLATVKSERPPSP